MNAPIDPLHAECLSARNRIRQAFAELHQGVSIWSPATMPPDFMRVRGAKPVAVWLDEDVSVPVTWDADKIIYADDPLLRNGGRNWLR